MNDRADVHCFIAGVGNLERGALSRANHSGEKEIGLRMIDKAP
jgi:hypothetical protein